MKPRFLASIDARIGEASSPVERARLEARKASYLARQGEKKAARDIVLRLREQSASTPDATLSALLHLADGLLDFFHDLNPIAADKFRRAYALAAAVEETSVQALAAAWLAHMDFSAHRFDSMGVNLTRAFEAASADDHGALSRCSSVCAVSLHLAGDYKASRHWYRAARLHGLEEGDNATTSAYMHNLAAMAVMNLRQAVLSGAGHGRQEFNALHEAESAESYDELIGAMSLDTLLPILRANIFSLRAEPAEALEIYREHVLSARRQGMERMAPWLLADMAWCHSKVGEPDKASALALEAEQQLEIIAAQQMDDTAAAWSRLAEVFSLLRDDIRAAACRHRADDAWARFRQMQQNLLLIIGSVQSRFGHAVLPRDQVLE